MCNSHFVTGSRTGAARGPFRELSYRVLNLPYCTQISTRYRRLLGRERSPSLLEATAVWSRG